MIMSETLNNVPAAGRCPTCGLELPEGVAPDRCPRCLLRAGLASQSRTVPVTSQAVAAASVPPALPASRPVPGQQFGHYQIVRLLGEGGMGASYEAEDLETGRRLALKVLTHALDSAEARKRFLREGRLAASVNHPNSVYVFGTEEIDDTPVIAMELVPGGTLRDRVAARGPLPIGEAVDCILEVILGLEAAYAVGVLHRDIKPSNCFVDSDGTVKVGDFGLSISKTARWDSTLTVAGAFLGTPAFSSPEQLRGDDLTVRSDIYSVGVTLYYLLTGKTPFEAANIVQLLATVLERRAESLARWRPELPNSLCATVLRCLEKQPANRFGSYGELRAALLPHASSAPTPATLRLRFLAGLTDKVILGVHGTLAGLALGGWQAFTGPGALYQPRFILAMLLSFAVTVGYYAVLEGRWGFSLGKALCRLRVVGPQRSAPGVPRALLRALVYEGVPLLPLWLFLWLAPAGPFTDPFNFRATPLFHSPFLVLGLLFCTARRKNGFAACQDLVSGTRVVEKSAYLARPAAPVPEAPPAPADTAPQLGPYHVLGTLCQTEDEELLEGFDTRLLRRVWIRRLPPGAPPVAPSLRNLARPGRLRWLNGHRSPTASWDAYEALAGRSLLALAVEKPGWERVRFWLHDLAEELRAAARDHSLPEVLDLDRVWITADGRAKLLDFPAPGAKAAGGGRVAPAASRGDAGVRLLQAVAAAALCSTSGRSVEAAEAIPAAPLPLHAREFLDLLRDASGVEPVAAQLAGLLNKVAAVTRLRRLGLVAGCAFLPVASAAALSFGFWLYANWIQSQPTLAGLEHWLGQLEQVQSRPQAHRDQNAGVAAALEIYIAGHFGATITNPATWSDLRATRFINGRHQRLARELMARHASVSEAERTNALAVLRAHYGKPPETVNTDPLRQMNVPAVVAMMTAGASLAYVVLPTWLGALLFRGGLLLHLFGLAVVRPDGKRASRLRVLWRGVLAWAPLFLLPILGLSLARATGGLAALILALVLYAALVSASVLWPERSLQDRLAGTWLVPR
jgi:hypothetical protein